MIEKLIELMNIQEKHLNQLLSLLKIQKKLIMKKDAFSLELLVDKLSECSKEVAKDEVERRKILNNRSLKEIVYNSESKDLKEIYLKIEKTVNEVINQKDTNELLLKQQLMFTNKMLNIMNPSREIKTYNSIGGLRT